MRKYLLLLLLTPLCSCAVETLSDNPTQRVTVGPGPEDMVLDRSQEHPRLLISCTRRRDNGPPFGEIVAYTPATGQIDTLERTGMPDTLFFQPHGIFLDDRSGDPVLYAISHEHDRGFHPVYLWKVGKDSLEFIELARSPLLHSPNALTLGAEGDIYVVNDAGKRGSVMEKIFALNRADIVRLFRTGDGTWNGKVVAGQLGYPAGINRLENTIYAGDAVNDVLHMFEIREDTLLETSTVEGLKGNDNIRVAGQDLYITGHVKPMRFVRHTRSPEKRSPVKVWKVDPGTMEVQTLYYTDGSEISAGSTAIPLDGKLYISQVFDPFILVVTLP